MTQKCRTTIAGCSCERSAWRGASRRPASRPPPPRPRRARRPAYPGSGYFTSLKTKHVGCKTGRKVTLAHYNCRTAHGKKGRCKHKVLRYSCTEKRFGVIATEYNARVTCKRGAKRVIYVYQQNT